MYRQARRIHTTAAIYFSLLNDDHISSLVEFRVRANFRQYLRKDPKVNV